MGQFKIISEHLNGVVVVQPEVFGDHRGFFMESFRADQFKELGLPIDFVQDNHSRSKRGVIRGLHFQWDKPQAKLMRVTLGKAFVVAVDIRKASPTLGKWHGIEISAEDKLQVYAPAGFARGFCVLSEYAEIQYKCTSLWNPNAESGILWSDPDINIQWPISNPVLSDKDMELQTLSKWLMRTDSDYFRYI